MCDAGPQDVRHKKTSMEGAMAARRLLEHRADHAIRPEVVRDALATEGQNRQERLSACR